MRPKGAQPVAALALMLATGAMVAAMPGRLRAPQGRRIIGIVVDDANMRAGDIDSVTTRLATVRSALRDSGLVAIVSTGYSSVALDVTGAPAIAKRLDQAVDKIRGSIPQSGSDGYAPRAGSPLYSSHAGFATGDALLEEMTKAAVDPKVLVWVSGPQSFDAFNAIRRLKLAGQPLPQPTASWHTAPGDLSANIVMGELETLLQTAEQHHVTFMTIDGNGYASWKGDGTSERAAGIGQ